MMTLVSGIIRLRASSRSTGILPIGQSFRYPRAPVRSSQSTICGSNGVSFSYSAISTFWQNDDSGMEMEFQCQ